MEGTAIEIIKQVLIAVGTTIVATNTLTAAIRGIFHIENSVAVQVLSWVVAILSGLSFVLCGQLDFGLAPVWNYVLGGVTGIIAGGAANKLYDWTKIRRICEMIVELFEGKKEEPKVEIPAKTAAKPKGKGTGKGKTNVKKQA